MYLPEWIKSFSDAFAGRFAREDIPAPNVYFTEEECARLHVLQTDTLRAVDQQTWSDLLVGPYFSDLAARGSIFARQILFQRLRTGLSPTARTQARRRVEHLMQNPTSLARQETHFGGMRKINVEVAGLLFDESRELTLPKWAPWVGMLPLLMVAAAAALAMSSIHAVFVAAVLSFTAVLLVMFGVHMHYDHQLEVWELEMRAIVTLLVAALSLGNNDCPALAPFAKHGSPCTRICKKLSRLRMPLGVLVHQVTSYLDWFTMKKVRHYFKQVQCIARERTYLRTVFVDCANLEADLVIARHLLSARFCWAELDEHKGITLNDAIHPLQAEASPMSLTLASGGIFLSGQNGIGKTTFLRTVGINAILARGFGFCYASAAVMSDLDVHASIHNEDSLADGESMYIAELRRARELLDKSCGHSALYLIDEIFRGTNYLESVSAAASFLHKLADQGLVIVSSHNLVLSPILASKYKSKHVGWNEISQQLCLLDGVLVETNGLSLLSKHGFSVEFEEDARRVNGWLSSYLAFPAGPVDVLGSKAS